MAPFYIRVFPGVEAFKLYSSMGFPIDLLTLMAEEKVTKALSSVFVRSWVVLWLLLARGMDGCMHGCTLGIFSRSFGMPLNMMYAVFKLGRPSVIRDAFLAIMT